MKKINVSFDDVTTEGSYYIFNCANAVENESFGDLITICATDNAIEISDFIDVDDNEIRGFIKENVVESQSLLGFMRRVTK